jgi:integrase
LSFQQRRPHRSGRGRSLQTEDVLAVRGNKHDGYTVEFESKRRRVFRRLPAGATKGQAEAYELKLRRELIDQAVLGQAPAITIAAAVKAWQEEVADKRTSSKKEQASKIKITLEGLDELQLGGHPLTDIQAVAQELEELWEGKAPSTINSRLNVLKATCKWAWKKKRWTVYNLSPFVTPQRVGPGRARTIDEPTIAKLIKKAATAEGKAFIALGAYALMRQSEVMRLDPADAKGGIKIRDWDDRVRTIDIVPQLRPHLKALPLTRHKRTLYTEFEAGARRPGAAGPCLSRPTPIGRDHPAQPRRAARGRLAHPRPQGPGDDPQNLRARPLGHGKTGDAQGIQAHQESHQEKTRDLKKCRKCLIIGGPAWTRTRDQGIMSPFRQPLSL